jgi:hypothetical protein
MSGKLIVKATAKGNINYHSSSKKGDAIEEKRRNPSSAISNL